MKVAISIENLTKKYNELEALKSLSFQVKEGECAGLLGPNGAGKSTTIKILTGQLQPTSGSVKILDIDPIQNPKKVHDFIGYVPDIQSIYDEITVEQNIDIFRRIYREPKERTKEIIHRVDLIDQKKTKAKNLSRGLRQRLLLARTLVHTPKILFLDEPTTGLDPSSTDFICQILEELKRNKVTMLLSTHLMSLAERLCNHIVLLNKGEKKEEGTLSELKGRYGDSQIKVKFLSKGKEEITMIPFNNTFIDELAKIHRESKILSINTNEASLEDIFIRIARGDK